MKKLTIYQLLVITLIPLLLIVTAVSSIAWIHIDDENTVDTHISQGSVIQQYFHCGDGSASNPFVITRPIHYYHLCELYERGSDFYNKNYCFQLGYDLDGDGEMEVYNYDNYGNTDGSVSDTLNMSYYSGKLTLIPIGTSNKPFNGTFDGSGLTVSNLSIIASETITNTLGTTTYDTCDVGIFGYVGANASIKDVYYDGVTIELTGANINTACSGVVSTSHDTNDDNTADTIYVGFIIGHLYQYENASGIDYTQNTVTDAASPISNVYINNAKIVGGNSTATKCEYGYIGYIDVIDSDTATTIASYYDSVSYEEGGNEGWGGSLDMTALYNRIDSIHDSTSLRTYPTSETIVGGDTKSAIPSVSITGRSSSNLSSGTGTLYYWSAANVSSTDFTGGTYIGSQSSTWNYLYGLSSTQLTTTTSSTKTGTAVEAYYIYDNGAYLTFKGNGITGESQAKNASKWIRQAATASTYYYYCYVGNVAYYLTTDSNHNLSCIQFDKTNTPSTWLFNTTKEFTTTINSTPYYLYYNGSWVLTESVARYVIADKADGESDVHYLAATTNGYFTETDKSSAAMWLMSDPDGASTTFYFTSGSQSYYLSYDGGLTISTSPISWTKEVDDNGTHYYYEVNLIKYYLIYDNGWKAVMTDGYTIHDGTHYIGIDNSGALYDTSESNAAIFQVTENDDASYTIIANINGTGQYLSSNGVTLTLSSSDATSWYKDSEGRYYRPLSINGVNGSANYYLMYNGEWKLGYLSGYKFAYENHYLGLNGTTITDVGVNDATLWQMNASASSTTLYTIIGNQAYYLGVSSTGLALTTGTTTWTKDGSAYYTTVNNTNGTSDNAYIAYQSGWTVSVKDGSKIHDNNGHYITNTNAAITSTDEANAIVWQIKLNSNNKYYIYNLVGTTRYYLGVTSGVLSRTTTAFEWEQSKNNGATQYYYEDSEEMKHYLYYQSDNNTGWTLIVIETQVKVYYQETSTKKFYLHTTGTGVGSVIVDSTNANSPTSANAINWIQGTDCLYTYIGNTKYYLAYETYNHVISHVDSTTDLTVLDGASVELRATVSTTKSKYTTIKTEGTGSTLKYYIEINETKFYLVYDEAENLWKYESVDGFVIKGNDETYIMIDYSVTSTATVSSITYDTPIISCEADNAYFYYPIYKKLITNGSYYDYNSSKTTNTYSVYCFYTIIGDTVYYLHHAASSDDDIMITLNTTPYDTSESSLVDKFFIYSDNNIYFICNEIRYELGSKDGILYFAPMNLYSIKASNLSCYLNYNTSKSLTTLIYNDTDTTDEKDDYYYAQYKWLFTAVGTNQYKISCSFDGESYYLYNENHGNLILSKSNFTTWNVIEYTEISGETTTTYYKIYENYINVNFYLDCIESGSTYTWKAEPDTYYTILQGNNYLSGSSTSLSSSTSVTSSCKWIITEEETNKWLIAAVFDNKLYYLTSTALGSLTISTDKSYWQKDGTQYYKTYSSTGSLKFYINYNGTSWVTQPKEYSTITQTYNSATHYLQANGTSINDSTSSDVTLNSKWIVQSEDSGYTIGFIVNNEMNYLTLSSTGEIGTTTNLSLSTTKFYWTKDGTQFYKTINGIKYYICYNGSIWSAQPKEYYTISQTYGDSTIYMQGSGTTITSATSVTANDLWFIENSKLYTYVSGTKYYLNHSITAGFTLSISSGTTCSYEISGNNINEIAFDSYYLCYDCSGWNVNIDNGYRISSGSNYLTCKGSSGVENSTVESKSSKWYFTGTKSGNIYCFANGKKYFLNYVSSLTVNETATSSWSRVNENFDILYTTVGSNTTRYYLEFSTSWQANTKSEFAIAYKYSNTLHYLTAQTDTFLWWDTGFSTDDTTTFSNAYYWTIDGTSGVKLHTSHDGSTVYVYGNRGSIYVSDSSPSSTWTLSDNQLYYTYRNNKYYLYYSGSSWTNTTSANTLIFIPRITMSIDEVNSLTYATGNKVTNSTASYTTGTNPDCTYGTVDNTPTTYVRDLMTKSNLESSVTFITKINNTNTVDGHFVNETVAGLQANVYLTNYSFSLASPTSGSITSVVSLQETNLVKTVIHHDIATVNPTVTLIQTTETPYVTESATYKRGTYLALQAATQDDEEDSINYYSDYRASEKNTGYLVGGTYSSASGSGRGDIRVSGYSISNISSSYKNNSFSTIYTFNDSGTSAVAINDSVNTYTRYTESKANFLSILQKNSSYVYGLHFMDAAISTSHIMTAEAVRIQNKTYVNYQLPESCIDFNVYTQGNIVLYAGDYYDGNSCFFSLNQVFRNSDNTISAIKEISEVYTKPGLTEKGYYIYKYSDGTYSNVNGSYTGATSLASGYTTTPIFKTKWLTNPTNGSSIDASRIYYFECPCNKGEYALGSVSGQDGGYLLYLDIATNGTQSATYNQAASLGTDALFTQIDYRSSGTVLNSHIYLSYSLPSTTTNANFSVMVSYSATNVVYDAEYNIDCTFYTITIQNTTGLPLDMTIVLVDNDDDIENEYPFRYKIYYNGDEYTIGNSYNSDIGGYYASDVYNFPIA